MDLLVEGLTPVSHPIQSIPTYGYLVVSSNDCLFWKDIHFKDPDGAKLHVFLGEFFDGTSAFFYNDLYVNPSSAFLKAYFYDPRGPHACYMVYGRIVEDVSDFLLIRMSGEDTVHPRFQDLGLLIRW